MSGRRTRADLCAAFALLGGLAGPAPAEAIDPPGLCIEQDERVICAGNLQTAAIEAYRGRIEASVQAAKGLEPAEVPDWPDGLCNGLAGIWTARAVTEAIEDQTKDAPPITFRNMRISGPFRLAGDIARPVTFENVSFCGDVTLAGTFTHSLRFDAVAVSAPSGPGLFRAAGATFERSVDLTGLVAGSVDLGKANFGDRLDLSAAMFGHLRFAGAATPDLLMPGIRQLIGLYDGFAAAEARRPRESRQRSGPVVDLTGARVGNQLYGDWARIEGGVSAARLETGVLRFQIAQIAHAHFGNIVADTVRFGGATLGVAAGKALLPCGTRSVLITDPRILSFEGARVAGDMLLETRVIPSRGSTHLTTAHAPLCLRGMNIGGRLGLAGLRAQHLDLAGVEIGGDLQLGAREHGPLVWPDAARSGLDLARARIGRLTLSDALSPPAVLNLTGARIDAVDAVPGPGLRARGHDILSDMIAGLPDPAARGPAYRVLEMTLTQLGQPDAARQMAFLRRQSQTATLCWFCSVPEFFQKALARSSEALGGYGLRPERTLVAAAISVALGALVAGLVPGGRAPVAARLGGACAGRGRWAFELALLSLDRLIPLVSLDKLYSEWAFSGRLLRGYFVLHAILGLLLAGSVVTFLGRSFGFSA